MSENLQTPKDPSKPSCATCPMRKRAEANPRSLIAKLWKWHTGWCPGWKAYQATLADQQS
jgi:hypothetical protein